MSIGSGGSSGKTGPDDPLTHSPPPGDVPAVASSRQDAPLNDYLRPMRIALFAPYVLRSLSLTTDVPTLLAPASPLRVGLLCSHTGLAATVVQAGPLLDSTVLPVLWVAGRSLSGGTLGELLSLIGAEWWAVSPADVTLYVVEFTRPL